MQAGLKFYTYACISKYYPFLLLPFAEHLPYTYNPSERNDCLTTYQKIKEQKNKKIGEKLNKNKKNTIAKCNKIFEHY